MTKSPKSKLKSKENNFYAKMRKEISEQKLKQKKSLKMERKIQVSQDKLKQECLYYCLQQYEEK